MAPPIQSVSRKEYSLKDRAQKVQRSTSVWLRSAADPEKNRRSGCQLIERMQNGGKLIVLFHLLHTFSMAIVCVPSLFLSSAQCV